MTDWMSLSRRAAFVSHRMIGWIFWDPVGVANYAALGVPDGLGYYVVTRAAPLAAAGSQAVTASFFSISPAYIDLSLDLCREHTTFEAAAAARDAAVVEGLHTYVPEICDEFAAMADPLWEVADSLSSSGRVLFAAHREWPRPDDQLLSAWLALNCLREWRGDTHFAIQVTEDLDGDMAGILDNAWRSYEGDWIPRSRGADDAALDAAYRTLEQRGLAEHGRVNEDGIRLRQELEDRLDRLTIPCWELFGAAHTERLIELIEPVDDRLIRRIDETAGTNWMPAGRVRPDSEPVR